MRRSSLAALLAALVLIVVPAVAGPAGQLGAVSRSGTESSAYWTRSASIGRSA